jgi:hypothetical protein
MSTLKTFGRPWVKFDAANKQHRRWFAEFLQTGTWGRCPVRFCMDEDQQGELLGLIKRDILDYYAAREFGQQAA